MHEQQQQQQLEHNMIKIYMHEIKIDIINLKA
jgi:hypothetical protein